MKKLIVHRIVLAALMLGMTGCSSDTDRKGAVDAGMKENVLCQAQPAAFDWNGRTYRLKQENTDEEPMMKFGWLGCEAGRLVPADDDFEAFATLYSTGEPTDGQMIMIGQWGRTLYELAELAR
ncbi:hypothetical protein D3C84_863590 [compost metagenome]